MMSYHNYACLFRGFPTLMKNPVFVNKNTKYCAQRRKHMLRALVIDNEKLIVGLLDRAFKKIILSTNPLMGNPFITSKSCKLQFIRARYCGSSDFGSAIILDTIFLFFL